MTLSPNPTAEEYREAAHYWQEECAKRDDALKLAREELAEAKDKFSTAVNQREELHVVIKRLRSELTAKLEEVTRDKNEMLDRYATAQAARLELEAQRDTALADVARLTREIEDRELAISAYADVLKANGWKPLEEPLQDFLTRLTADAATWQRKAEEAQRWIDPTFASEVAQLRAQLRAELAQAIADRDNQKAGLEETLQRLHSLDRDYDELESSLAQANQSLSFLVAAMTAIEGHGIIWTGPHGKALAEAREMLKSAQT